MQSDFYILSKPDQQTRYLFACRLIEKAYHLGNQIFVHTQDETEANKLDNLLWTFKDNSFIPHNLQGESLTPPPPVQIGYAEEPKQFNNILINLSQNIPPYFKRFKRIIEIVPSDENWKQISRDHFKYYRTQGLSPNTHKIP